MFIPLMDNDAGEYAIVAMRMAQRSDFINIIRQSEDYLDKPHLLFWLSAISMKIFGFTSFAYKLPSVLFAFAAIYATTKLGSLLYNKQTGLLAGLILAYSQAFILSNHDVRTDAILTGATIFAIYKFIQFSYSKKYIHIIAGAFFLALAVGTKGMVAVFVTGTTVLIHLLYHKQGKEIFRWKWLSSIVWFLLFLSPFLYCYYLQFDAHPEKVIKGATNVSGVKFLLWSQSFERLSGQGNMVSNPDYFFFFHTLLWAFLPWSIITYFSLFTDIKTILKNKFKLVSNVEACLSIATVVLLLIFSLSKFKLPHYLNILFPLMAIFTASNMLKVFVENKFKWMGAVFYSIAGIYVVAVVLINGLAFPIDSFLNIVIGVGGAAFLLYILFRFPSGNVKPLLFVMATVGISNLLIDTNFYPKLLSYQGGITLSDFVKNNQINTASINYFVADRCFSFDYYTHTDIPEKNLSQLQEMEKSKQPFYIVTDNRKIGEIVNSGIPFKQIKSVDDYHITLLTLPFMNPATRKSTLEQLILLQVN